MAPTDSPRVVPAGVSHEMATGLLWRRLCAHLIDMAIVVPMIFVVGFTAALLGGGAALFVTILVVVIYYAAVLKVLDGRTPGKYLLHLRVVDERCQRAPIAQALLRELIKPATFCTGFWPLTCVVLLCDAPAHRSLEDRIARTQVKHFPPTGAC